MTPAGRPTDYEPKYVELAFWMAQAGLTDKQMAEEMGIAESTFYEWKKEHPEFSESIRAGKDTPDSAVEAALFRKAKGFKYEEGKKQRVALPDTVACIFWLKNRRPDRWRDKHDIDVKGNVAIHFDKEDKEL